MTNEEKNKLLEKIRALGFTPFPYADEREFEFNPGRINPPSQFNPDDWLTINQCEVIAKKSDRTIYRWQTTASFINFTILAEGKDRNTVRHYILKNDFLQFLEDTVRQKVVYIYENPLTQTTEGISDKSTEGRVKPLTPDMTIRQERQKVIDIDPETKEKLLALPQELSQRIQDAFTQALTKQKEELTKELSKFDQFFSKQLEYKEAETKSREELKFAFSRLHKKALTVSVVSVVLVCAIFSGLLIWQNNKARLEREEAQKRLTTEYTQKIDSLQNSWQDSLKDVDESLSLIKEHLKVKEEAPEETQPKKEEKR